MGKLRASSVWYLCCTESHSPPSLRPGPVLIFTSIASVTCLWETSGQVRTLTKGFFLLSLWKPICDLSILWVYSILGCCFFSHMQGSKTSVFIKDILFFRLEKIATKGRINKSLQNRRPIMCSPQAAILP